jgi:hypothetical protein
MSLADLKFAIPLCTQMCQTEVTRFSIAIIRFLPKFLLVAASKKTN